MKVSAREKYKGFHTFMLRLLTVSAHICEGHEIDIVLPTGAMGNMTGGYIAKQMGVPIGKLCAGVNINGKLQIRETCYFSRVNRIHVFVCSKDITNRVITSGEFHKKKIRKTLSDAINIEVASNIC